jgi:hypothetical protein
MAVEFDFIGPNDQPALLALSSPELLSETQTVLRELAYKVHAVPTPEDFTHRFSQAQYHIVFIEEGFAGSSLAENPVLQEVQRLPMNQRRHAVFILIGPSFESLNAMQAFQQSVHAVLNPAELASLKQVIQKFVSDNNLFLHLYRDTALRIAQGKG